jgi:hypothetical protein
MPNPFPGVDPFLEVTDLWVGFHNTLVGDFGKLLNPGLLPRGYIAVVEKRVDLVDSPAGPSDDRHPDLLVTTGGQTRSLAAAESAAAVMELETVKVTLPSYESVPVAFINIRSLPGRELVTVIELLSPANKTGGSRGDYRAKRAALLSSAVNLVEIDLLLVGRRPDVIGTIPPGEFCVLVSRGDRRPDCEAGAWSIRRSLPRLMIPLRAGERDATLDLAAAYSMTYEGGAYDLIIPYDRPLAGALSAADSAWVADRLAERVTPGK